MKSTSFADAYEPQLQKSMKNVLCSRFTSEYGFLGGKEVIELIVNDLLRIVATHQMPLSKVKKGQIVWQAVAKDETTSYGKLMRDTRTVPVILTLASDEDIKMRIKGTPIDQIRKTVIERIFKEADEQGGTMSQADVAILLAISKTSVSEYVQEIQKEKEIILGIEVKIHEVNPFDFKECLMKTIELIQNEPAKEKAVNVTGGTKTLSLAANSAAWMCGCRIFKHYRETDEADTCISSEGGDFTQ